MADEIIAEFGDYLESITLAKGSSGQFEVTLDGQKVYSKSETKRHPAEGEVIDTIRRMMAGNNAALGGEQWVANS